MRPYYPEGKPIVRNSFCVFLDILGFRDEIQEARKNGTEEELFNRLYSAMKKGETEAKDNEALLWEYKVFTDNVILGYPFDSAGMDKGENAFGFLISSIMYYQMAMIEEGFFVRGGWSVGPLFVGDEMVFGSALLDAYDLENSKAVSPKIVLAPNVVALVKGHLNFYADKKDAPQYEELLMDVDGQYFVNYLSVLDYGEGIDWDGIKLHKDVIEKRLKENQAEPKKWHKYLWAAHYHNYFCDQFKRAPGYQKSFLIDSGLIRQEFSRII